MSLLRVEGSNKIIKSLKRSFIVLLVSSSDVCMVAEGNEIAAYGYFQYMLYYHI